MEKTEKIFCPICCEEELEGKEYNMEGKSGSIYRCAKINENGNFFVLDESEKPDEKYLERANMQKNFNIFTKKEIEEMKKNYDEALEAEKIIIEDAKKYGSVKIISLCQKKDSVSAKVLLDNIKYKYVLSKDSNEWEIKRKIKMPHISEQMPCQQKQT